MALRTLTFGDLSSGFWGAAWELGDGQPGLALVQDGVVQATLTADWRLEGDGVELETSPNCEHEGLVTVRGRFLIGGVEQAIDCLGRREVLSGLDPTSCDSIRDVSAWFGPEDGISVVAARPAGSRGHEDDVMAAWAFEAGQPVPIEEPRLSTTYDGDGVPIRAGLELWPEVVEEGDEEEPPVTHPIRAAGEAAGAVASTAAGPLTVQARLFRWHARGLEGAGVYVLARVT